MSFLARLLNKDALADLSAVIANLDFLAEAEAQIGEFYRMCAEAMPREADLWNPMADQEFHHAENAKRMRERITKSPEAYKPGISFSTVTIRMFAVEMQSLAERMRANQISDKDLFSVALEIEDSLIEVNYCKIAITEDGIFNMMARQNDNESYAHRTALFSRISASVG